MLSNFTCLLLACPHFCRSIAHTCFSSLTWHRHIGRTFCSESRSHLHVRVPIIVECFASRAQEITLFVHESEMRNSYFWRKLVIILLHILQFILVDTTWTFRSIRIIRYCDLVFWFLFGYDCSASCMPSLHFFRFKQILQLELHEVRRLGNSLLFKLCL